MSTKERDISLDIFKGLLIILMIIGHILQFFQINQLTDIITKYVNLTSFSGFMFANGYAVYISYLSKDMEKKDFIKKMLKNFVRVCIVFYICGIAFTVLVEKEMSCHILLQIISLQKIPAFCDYLISFAFLNIFTLIAGKWICKITWKSLLICSIFSLLMTFINYDMIKIPIIGVFIGTTTYACFPIVQYISYFLTGVYLAKNKIIYNPIILILSIIGTVSFGSCIIFGGGYEGLPSRFPPSIFWIVGGYFFVYLYYLLCKSERIVRHLQCISIVGKNTLTYLLISNLLIFYARYYVIMKRDAGEIEITDNFKIFISIILFVMSMTISWIYIKFIKKGRKYRKIYE